MHKKILVQQYSAKDSRASADRGVTPLNFLPTLPENQKGISTNAKLSSANNNSSSERDINFYQELLATKKRNSRNQKKHFNQTSPPTGMLCTPNNIMTPQVLLHDYTSRPEISIKDSSNTRTGCNYYSNSAVTPMAVNSGKSV